MTMSADEFRSIVNRLGWSYEIAANRARRSYSRFRKLSSGHDVVDEPLEQWLRALVALVNNPPPPLPRSASDDEDAPAS
jgi:hypothetical protein